MIIPKIESKRLLFRAYSPQDLESFLSILNNRNNLRYLPSKDPWHSSKVEKWLLSSQRHWLEEGYGWWILEHKLDAKAIGWCGLRKLEGISEVEVLYLLAEAYWGQGLATEATKLSIEYGFNRAGMEEIVGLVLDGNIASSKVLEKSGLCFEERAEYFSLDCLKYRIDKTRFASFYSTV